MTDFVHASLAEDLLAAHCVIRKIHFLTPFTLAFGFWRGFFIVFNFYRCDIIIFLLHAVRIDLLVFSFCFIFLTASIQQQI